MRTDDELVQQAFAVAKAAYDNQVVRPAQPELRAEVRDKDSIERLHRWLDNAERQGALLEAENERLRAALQDVLDLATGDAPAHMIVDVCDRALSVEP